MGKSNFAVFVDLENVGAKESLLLSIIEKVNADGTTVFLVEQNANQALRIATHGYVMENGRIVMRDTADRLLQSEEVRTAYLGM